MNTAAFPGFQYLLVFLELNLSSFRHRIYFKEKDSVFAPTLMKFS